MITAEHFRNRDIATTLVEGISKIVSGNIALMEVCGSHTMAIHRFGIPSLLPPEIKLISGPGCPVCVTSSGFIENAIALSRSKKNIITTYGDLIRVPGSSVNLEQCRAEGANIRIVKSPLEALEIAAGNPRKRIVFLGIGFETTTPSTAVAVLEARERKLNNFYLLSAHKIMPPALRALMEGGVRFDGLIAPGHVSAITGSSIYNFLAEEFRLACVISGFEPVDILQSIYMLIKQVNKKTPMVEIQYSRAVKPEGNQKAMAIIDQVFYRSDDWWRGLGIIGNSGLNLRDEFSSFDAKKYFNLEFEENSDPAGCICGSIMKGLSKPTDCPWFGKRCTPEEPVGACMVSQEGSCQAYFRYSRANEKAGTKY